MVEKTRTVTQRYSVCDICGEECHGSWTSHTYPDGRVEDTCSVKCEKEFKRREEELYFKSVKKQKQEDD